MLKNLGLIVLLSCYSHLSLGEVSIRIRVAKHLKQVKLSGYDLERRLLGKSPVKYFSGKKSINFNCEPVVKSLKNNKPILLASLKSRTGLMTWNKNRYLGEFNLVSSKYNNGCDLINELSLESYIATLLSKEMSPKWPLEALKAQAVAARSYAYHKKITKQVSREKGHEAYYDLENSEKHQVNGSFLDATYKTSKAARETKGEILTLKTGRFTPIFFHSKCGGKTMRPDQVWTNFIPGYQSVECPYCHKHGIKNWNYEIKKDKLASYLEKTLRVFYSKNVNYKAKDLKLVPDDSSRTFFRVYNKDNPTEIQKSRLRQILGRSKMPSNYYEVNENGESIILSGKGFGHGVGMCQYGAFELAKRGYTYRQILAHYFPEHIIKKLY